MSGLYSAQVIFMDYKIHNSINLSGLSYVSNVTKEKFELIGLIGARLPRASFGKVSGWE
jgi:hypothetical protein